MRVGGNVLPDYCSTHVRGGMIVVVADGSCACAIYIDAPNVFWSFRACVI